MYTPSTLLVLAAAAVSVNALTFADRVAVPLARRDISRGWAVLASSAPADSVSCGGGAYCPASLTCFDAKNSEVASCCPGTACVGEIEGSPNCADGSNNMFSGIDGNGFCCLPGQVGVIDRQARTVNCVASGDVGSQSTAVLTKTGTGAAPTSAPAASSSSASASSASSSSSNGTATTTTSSSANASNTSTSNGAGVKEAAMGLVAAGLMIAAAL